MLSEQISIVTGRNNAAGRTGIDTYYSAAHQSNSRATGKMFESPYTLSTIADPYIRNIDKQLYLKNNYKQMMGKNAPMTKLMKSSGMQPGQEQFLAQRLNGNDARFTTEDIRSFSDMVWKNMQGFSRFFAQGLIRPADVHTSETQRFFNQGQPLMDGRIGDISAGYINNAYLNDTFGDMQERAQGRNPNNDEEEEKQGTGFGGYFDTYADNLKKAFMGPQQQQEQSSLTAGDGQQIPQQQQQQQQQEQPMSDGEDTETQNAVIQSRLDQLKNE